MTLLVVGYGLISLAALIGNLGIEAVRLLRAQGAPGWTEPLQFAFTAVLAPIVIVATAPLWAFGRGGIAGRR